MELHFIIIQITKNSKSMWLFCFIQISDEDGKVTSTEPTSDEIMDNKSFNGTETLSSEGKKNKNI